MEALTAEKKEVDGILQKQVNSFGDITLFNQINDLVAKSSDPNYKEKLKAEILIDGINRGILQLNRSANTAMEIFTRNAILIGKSLQVLKKVVRESGVNWEEYAEMNVKGLSDRTRQKYMRIAGYKHAEELSHFGVERLYLLVKGLEDLKIKCSHTEFIEKHNLNPDPSTDVFESVKQFKISLKGAMELEKVKENEIPTEKIDRDLVRALVEDKKQLDQTDIDDIKKIVNAGGDANKHLKSMIAAGGKTKNKKPDKKGKVKTLERLISDLKDFIAYFKEDNPSEEAVQALKINELDTLIEELTKLRSIMI